MERMRTPIVVGSLLIVCGVVGAIALRPRPTDEAPFLAESPVIGGRFRLRLLEISEPPFEYRWKAPRSRWTLPTWAATTLGLDEKDALPIGDIDIRFTGVSDRHGDGPLPAHGFLFRFVDQRGRWAHPRREVSPLFCFVESTGWIHNGGISVDHGDGAFLAVASSFPRREPTMRIVVNDLDDPLWTTLTTLDVPNPFYRGAFPAWTALPLPQSQTRGDRTVTLHALDSTRTSSGAVVSDVGPQGSRMRVYLEDATGNVGEILSPFEPVWKVVAVFDRPRTPQAPDPVHPIGSFPIPESEVEITVVERDCERFEFFVEPPQHLRDEAKTEAYRSAMMRPW